MGLGEGPLASLGATIKKGVTRKKGSGKTKGKTPHFVRGDKKGLGVTIERGSG